MNKYTLNDKKVIKALKNLSVDIINPLNNDDVCELIQVINRCEDLEKALDKACNELDFLNCRLLYHCNKYNRVDANGWRKWCMKK